MDRAARELAVNRAAVRSDRYMAAPRGSFAGRRGSAGLARLPSELIMRSSMGVLGAAGYIAIGAMHIARCVVVQPIGRSGSSEQRSAQRAAEMSCACGA